MPTNSFWTRTHDTRSGFFNQQHMTNLYQPIPDDMVDTAMHYARRTTTDSDDFERTVRDALHEYMLHVACGGDWHDVDTLNDLDAFNDTIASKLFGHGSFALLTRECNREYSKMVVNRDPESVFKVDQVPNNVVWVSCAFVNRLAGGFWFIPFGIIRAVHLTKPSTPIQDVHVPGIFETFKFSTT